MSIITTALKPLIKKALGGMMKDFIQPILDLIKTLVQPQQGTKFLITMAGLASMFFMHKAAIATGTSDIVTGLVIVAYYMADIMHKGPKQSKTEVTP